MRISDWSSDVCSSDLYAKEQGFWIDPSVEPIFTDTLELDLSTVVPSLAGPKRPQDRVSLPEVDDVFNADMANVYKKAQQRVPIEGKDFDIGDGDVTIAAITRSEERRVGKECVGTGRSRGGPDEEKKKQRHQHAREHQK